MGRLSTLELMAIKPTHINELWGMIAGYERPTVTHSLRPARESCEACHWPEARHDDTIRTKYRYAADAKSTEGKTTLQMHTGSGPTLASGDKDVTPHAPRRRRCQGIHWHIAQDVEYVALDPQKQKIALVEVRGYDGKVKATYFDATAGVSRADAEKMPRSDGWIASTATTPWAIRSPIRRGSSTTRWRKDASIGACHRSRRARMRSSKNRRASAARTRSGRQNSRR